MRRFRCPAVVLRRWPFSESSLTLRLLTPDLGAVPVLAKGVNKLTSGALGVLDTWAVVEAELGGADDAELLNLYRVSLLDRIPALSADTRRLAAAGVLAELAELGAPAGQPAPRVFLWLQEALQGLAGAAPAAVDAVLLAELLRGLELLGLSPLLEPEADTGRLWFSPAGGGAVRSPERPSEHARRLSEPALALLAALRGAPEDAAEADSEAVAEGLTILGEFLHYHLERPPRAWRALTDAASARVR